MMWLWMIWTPQQEKENPTVDALIDERRRLGELRSSYREFGFDELADSAREQIRLLTEKLRTMRSGEEA